MTQPEQPASAQRDPLRVGERVVVRFRLPEQDPAGPHLSDALGEILNISASAVVIATRRGELTIPLPSIVTAKRVPPPPQRRGHSAAT